MKLSFSLIEQKTWTSLSHRETFDDQSLKQTARKMHEKVHLTPKILKRQYYMKTNISMGMPH